jgi:hypothetical protein
MKLPQLQETKFNKRSGKETPVLRIYTTKRGEAMYFQLISSGYRCLTTPYFFWISCHHRSQWKNLAEFYARICGVN